MTNREKVIKGLEACVRELGECGLCPYDDGCNPGCGKKLYSDAVAMLKAQEPIRPIIGIIHNEDGSKSYFLQCSYDGTPLNEGDRYCHVCGKAVKWN